MSSKQEILNIITKRIKDFKEEYRQNLSILGRDEDELNYLIENCILNQKIPELIYIYIDPLYYNSTQIFKDVLFSSLSQYLNMYTSLDSLLSKIQAFLPSTFNYAKDILKTKPTKFSQILEIINKFINESKKRCVLLIKNFTFFEEIFKDFYDSFSKFLILQNKCMVILFDSHIEKAREILNSKLNLLFGGFEILLLDIFSFWDTYLYLTEYLRPQRFSSHFIAFFIQNLKSNLFYYHIFAQKIKEISRNSDVSEEDIIFRVFKELMYLRESIFFQKFISKLNFLKEKYKDHQDLIEILLLLSQGYIRKSDLLFFLKMDKNKFQQKIRRLCEIEYVENLGNIYQISDSLFSFWLSKIFPLHFSCGFFDAFQKMTIFKKRIKEDFFLFKEEFYKEKIQKVLELFSSFKDDTLIFDEQRLNFPFLKRIKVITYPEQDLKLLVGEGKDIVIVGIKEGESKEEDIYNFIERSRLIKNRNLKRIFISLGKISDSVKLIAKKDRIVLWGREELNNILRIYNKVIVL